MDESAQENQANAAVGGVVVAAAAGGGNGGGDEAGNVAAANQQNQAVSNIEVSANANQNGEQAMDVDTVATAVAAPPSSRYSLRKRKPLLAVQGSNSTSAAGGNSNSNSSSAVPAAADPFGYVNTAALTDRQFEKMLAQYEEDGVRERAQKKLRLERGYGDDDYPYEAPPEGCPPFSSLPKEAIQLVFELLPSVRSVFNLAFQSKCMLSFVEERTDIVIRSAIHENASNRNKNQLRYTMELLNKLVNDRAIYVPSPIRLLRLLCATRCERGSNCWCYDLKTELSASKNVENSSVRPFGFAICSKCSSDVGVTLTNWWNHWVRLEDKIAVANWNQLLNPNNAADLVIGPNGESIGPRFNALQVIQICATHAGDRDKQKEAFEALVKRLYGEEGSDELVAYEQACGEFVQIYETAQSDLKVWVEAKENREREERKRRNEEATAKKKKNLLPLISALEEAVADEPLKDLALDFEWQNSKSYPIKFACCFVSAPFGRMFEAPSSSTKKMLSAALTTVRERLQILSDNEDFTSLAFLTPLIDSNATWKKRFLQKVLAHCQEKNVNSLDGIVKSSRTLWSGRLTDRHNLNDDFFCMLDEKKYFDAILHILMNRNDLNDLVADTFVFSDSPNAGKRRDLARKVWRKVKKGRSYLTEQSFTETLKRCRREFTTMANNMAFFLERQSVKDYIAADPAPSWRISRKNAVESLWDPYTSRFRRVRSINVPQALAQVTPYDLLLNREYDLLLQAAQYYESVLSICPHEYENL